MNSSDHNNQEASSFASNLIATTVQSLYRSLTEATAARTRELEARIKDLQAYKDSTESQRTTLIHQVQQQNEVIGQQNEVIEQHTTSIHRLSTEMKELKDQNEMMMISMNKLQNQLSDIKQVFLQGYLVAHCVMKPTPKPLTLFTCLQQYDQLMGKDEHKHLILTDVKNTDNINQIFRFFSKKLHSDKLPECISENRDGPFQILKTHHEALIAEARPSSFVAVPEPPIIPNLTLNDEIIIREMIRKYRSQNSYQRLTSRGINLFAEFVNQGGSFNPSSNDDLKSFFESIYEDNREDVLFQEYDEEEDEEEEAKENEQRVEKEEEEKECSEQEVDEVEEIESFNNNYNNSFNRMAEEEKIEIIPPKKRGRGRPKKNKQ